MMEKFQFGKLHASSNAVESEMNDIKHRLLNGLPKPLHVDKFVSIHIKSFSGRAKLAMTEAQGNANTSDTDGNDECIEIKEMAQDDNETRKNAHTSDTGGNDKCIEIKEMAQDDNETRENAHTSDIDGNDGYIEMKEVAQDDNKTEPTTTVSRNDPIITTDTPDCESDSAIDSNQDLQYEQNWRNKNDPKKVNRTYLDTRPDWDPNAKTARSLGIGILVNGNLCTILTMSSKKTVVKNTCGFDSIMQILAHSCYNDNVRNNIENSEKQCFLFIREFLRKGPCNSIYKMRALLLKTVEFFVKPTVVNNIQIIDAASNIAYLCEKVFIDIPSVITTSRCDICGSTSDRKSVLFPINHNTMQKCGVKDLQSLIMTDTNFQQRCCDKHVHIKYSYGLFIFIEISYEDSSRRVLLNEFPLTLQIEADIYVLAGVVPHYGGSSMTSLGHYTALINQQDRWFEYDDLRNKPKYIQQMLASKAHLCIYVKGSV